MTISLNTNIPATGNKPSSDQPIMQQNTANIATFCAVDHVGFGSTSPPHSGYHNIIHLNPQAVDPGNTATFGQVYAKTISGDQQLFYESGSGTVSQLTGNASSLADSGYTTLPNGLILQWGQKANPGTTGSVSFPISFPSTNPPFIIQLTLQRTSGNQSVTVDNGTVPTAGGFHFLASSAGSNILYWFAIGN